MSNAWHCQLHHHQYGPLSVEQLKEMAEQGQLCATTLVRPAEDPQGWKPLSDCELPQVMAALPRSANAANAASNGNQSSNDTESRRLTSLAGTSVGQLDFEYQSTSTGNPLAATPAPVPVDHGAIATTDSHVALTPMAGDSATGGGVAAATPTTSPSSIVLAPSSPATTPHAHSRGAHAQPAATVQPVPTQPATAQPTTAQPTTVQPATVQPVPTVQPTTVQPTTAQPTAVQPTMVEPVVQPTTVQPTQVAPTVPTGIGVTTDPDGSGDPTQRFRRRKKNHLPLIIGGSIAAIAAVVTMVVALSSNPEKDNNESEVAAANNDTTNVSNSADGAATGNPETDPAATSPAAPAGGAAQASEPVVDRSGEVKSWSAMGRTMTLKGVCSLRLEAVWLETNDQGQRLKAKVTTTYLADNPIRYSSWQGTGIMKSAAAARILYPAQGGQPKRLHLTAPSASASAAPETLTKDTKITEVFSFPAPAETDMVAKLMLPKEAIGRETGPFGFEIPRTTWLAGVSPESAPPPAAIDPAPGAVPSDPAPMPETQPESMPENMPETKPEPMPKPDTNENPPSITDLIRKSVEKDKDAKKDAPDKDAPK